MLLSYYKELDWFKNTSQVRTVLFVCSANQCRSPFAEHIFNEYAKKTGIKAFSRGIKTDKLINDIEKRTGNKLTLKAAAILVDMEHRRVPSLRQHIATNITEKDLEIADLVIVFEAGIRDTLRSMYPSFAYKIFTLVGFVMGKESGRITIRRPKMENKAYKRLREILGEDLDVGNPYSDRGRIAFERLDKLKNIKGENIVKEMHELEEIVAETQNKYKLVMGRIDSYVKELLKILVNINKFKKNEKLRLDVG